MIKGYVFSNQLASNDIDSMIFRKMLDYNDGVLNGMALSNTNSSITIGEGNILVAGRPIGVIGSETVTAGTDSAYCKLVVEIDLSQTATVSTFEQVSFKIIKSTTAYPNVTQQDMDNGGTLYQVALAQFRTSANGITDFVDIRPMLDFEAIYTKIGNDVRALIDQLEEELQDVEAGSAYVLTSTYNTDKANFQKKITTGTAAPTGGSNGDIYIQYFE